MGVLEGRPGGKFSGNFSWAEEGEVGDDDTYEGRDEDGNLYHLPHFYPGGNKDPKDPAIQAKY